MQSVAITTNIYEFNSQPWKYAVDTTLCDNSLSVTGGNSFFQFSPLIVTVLLIYCRNIALSGIKHL
jgi:hypothetical protein